MLIHAILDELQEPPDFPSVDEDTGEVPLPAVDTITFFPTGPVAISLMVPDEVSQLPQVFVDVTNLPAGDCLALDVLLRLLQVLVHANGLSGKLWLIAHNDGLDYELSSATGDSISLRDLSRQSQAAIRGLLYAIARIGADHIDWDASTPKTMPAVTH